MVKLNPKRILLVHPRGGGRTAVETRVARLVSSMPPLGLLSLAAYLEQRGFSASVVDCDVWPDPDRLIRETLQRETPAWFGVSCTTASFHDGVRLARLAQETLPGIRTIFGGSHVAALKERILREYPPVDLVIAGEGEQPLLAVLEREGEGLGSVPGVVCRDAGGEPVFTGPAPVIADLDTLPFPAYDKLAGYPRRYQLPLFSYPRMPTTSCVTSRGCPYRCTYCDRSVFGPTFRYNSAEYLYEHVRLLHERYRIRHVAFYDDQFTLNRARIEEFTRRLADRPLGVTFNCAVRAEHVDEDLLVRLKAAGCWMISIGIETGDPDLLAQHRQSADLREVSEKIRLIKQAGIRAKGLVMIGLPGETETSIRRTRDYVLALPLDEMNLTKFTPFPGSPLYERIHEAGTFDEDWDKMDCMHFQFIPAGLTRERLDALYREFQRAYYSRPRVLWNYASMMWRSPHSWGRFVLNLGNLLPFAWRAGR